MSSHKLWDLARELRDNHTYVDLTHSFDAGQPKFHMLPDEERERLFTVDEHGFTVDRYSFVGQWGTHVDPPIHFVNNARYLDELPVNEMVLPLVVLDFHTQAEQDADFTPTIADIEAWEKEHGTIPEGSFVALRTDWSKRWPNPEAVFNADSEGVFHYPAWNVDVVKWLLDNRSITAIGHETTDTDLGKTVSQGQLPTELYLLQQDRWQIELLANLDQVPATGALIVATWAKPKNGTGFPARAFAILPRD
ncbi:cyclase family protein [Corynebacterium mendelii]|uniref:Cyclase family protein n=1 Tax=Corynebacterium mendelii TaxID=2765362 RepID=A0A939IUB2_9CORY|nr:cyclase family protein [Corynebacterium mendelii]MBN9644749.1 cyclase family protein [Corynebacterium mendelii]